MRVLDKGFVELVDVMGTERSIVNAARVSFAKDAEPYLALSSRDVELIEYLLVNNHTSPFEHVVLTLHVKCPLFIRSQWMRHRTQSFNELSRRYTSDDIEFYIPESLRKQASSNRQASTDDTVDYILDGYCDADGPDYKGTPVRDCLLRHAEKSLYLYESLLAQGVSREQARMVLPQSMYTRFYTTVDLHNLLGFLRLRDSEHAQYEMRLYAKAVKELVRSKFPRILEIVERNP